MHVYQYVYMPPKAAVGISNGNLLSPDWLSFELLMVKWLDQGSQWHGIYCHDLEVMSSHPSGVELGMHGTSVLSQNGTKHGLMSDLVIGKLQEEIIYFMTVSVLWETRCRRTTFKSAQIVTVHQSSTFKHIHTYGHCKWNMLLEQEFLKHNILILP